MTLSNASHLLDVGLRYRVIGAIGEGAFGAVYEAVEVASGRRVALKLLTRQSPAALSDFKREFRALAGLNHENLVALRELYEHHGLWVIAMDLVEGPDLLSWVRHNTASNDQAPAFDEQRLRHSFAGVAQGLAALHTHGLLHRDLKPANVRLDSAGRAVLLDFGLVTASDDKHRSSSRGGGAGTAAYMAPEQATGEGVGPASDFYALGTCLYEALTGRLPFEEETSFVLALRKSREDPPPPSRFSPGVPQDLEALCLKLLDRDPARRPRVEQVLCALLRDSDQTALKAWSTHRDPQAVFEGRRAELAALREAALEAQAGQLCVAIIEGESGIGKSALLSELVKGELERAPTTWILGSRCYEHEHVPYKAFDGGMSALAKALAKLNHQVVSAYLPRRAGLLPALFPVLRSVKAFSTASTQHATAEPGARRQEAFQAFVELLGRLAEARPIMLLIDDLQWADQESLLLLRALVEDGSVPVLIACTVRPSTELAPEMRDALDALRTRPATRWIRLEGLGSSLAQLLAQRLLGAEAPREVARKIAHESEGHPMLIAELVHYTQTHGASPQALTLDAALGARIEALEPFERYLLDAIALSHRPHVETLFAAATRCTDFDASLKQLLALRLVRRNASFELAPAHDRIRAAARARIQDERARALHRALALELSRLRCGDTSEQALHWDLGLEPVRALAAYTKAADEAFDALAFANVIEHCTRALTLLGHRQTPERSLLLARRAQAQVALGHSAKAAEDFAEAAAGAPPEERTVLRVRAAQHQIQSAQIDQGMEHARELLAELGVPLPRGKGSAIARIVWERLRIAVRGYDVREGAPVAPEDKRTLDAIAGLIFPASWADLLSGNALNMCHLRRALELAEPGHAARALSQEAVFNAMLGKLERCSALLVRAEALAASAKDPSVEAFLKLARGSVCFIDAQPAHALPDLQAAEELLLTSCPSETWLLTNVRMALGATYFALGEHRLLRRSMEQWLAEAERRGDPFAMTALLGIGYGITLQLARNRVDEALELIESAMRPWQGRPHGFAHHGEILARTSIASYAGSKDAWRWLCERAREHDRAVLYSRGQTRDVLMMCRCSAGLAAYATVGEAERAPLLVAIEGFAKRIRSDFPSSNVGSALLRAQIEGLRGHRDVALAAARRAHELGGQLGLPYVREGASYLRGTFEGGEAGRSRCQAALRFFQDQGWEDPWRAIAQIAPALRGLEQEPALANPGAALLLDRYRLRTPLASGDHGPARGEPVDAMYGAIDVRTGRPVTLRVLSNLEPSGLSRLKEELRTLERVQHENLVRTDGLYEADGRLIVVMEEIPDQDFLGFVRSDATLNEERLRSVLQQTLSSLLALHEAGAPHSAICPSRLRITDAGRVIALGGHALPTSASRSHTLEAGELSYIAPEALDDREPSPAGDIYALGTCLYQALTGLLPFDHLTIKKMREAKQRGRPVPPWALRLEVPGDLEELCLSMLERDPAQRPNAQRALERLRAPHGADSEREARRARALASLVPASTPSPAEQACFAGRQGELEILRAGLEQAEGGGQACLCIQGESGIGKTALVAHSLEQLKARCPDALVLRSRCYANERLRYQAFDGVVEELARVLSKLPDQELQLLLPPRAALLAQMFPALGAVPRIKASSTKGLPAERASRRQAAIEVFVELLVRLGRRFLVVLVMDDLQWADAESFALIGELLAQREGVRMALVTMLRPNEARDRTVREALTSLMTRPWVVQLTVRQLDEQDARSLARSLLGAHVSAGQLEAAVQESGGHPLFLQELARSLAAAEPGARPDLEQVLKRRIQGLEPGARALMELLALMVRPCSVHVLERAAGLHAGFDDTIRYLLRIGLVQRRGESGLACFHDRLREVVASGVSRERAVACCASLAEALDAEPGSDAAERARLWDEAGDHVRAWAAYEAAGNRALDALAFSTAERLLARALELAPTLEAAPLARLLSQRAHAFVALGKSAEAAALFEQAALRSDGADAARLRVWAAQHQIQSAQFEAGVRNATAVLSELDVPLSSGPVSSLSRIVCERTFLAIRGRQVSVRSDVGERDKLRLDAMADLIFSLCWADLLPGQALNMVYQRSALMLGEPSHAARALAQEATFRALLDDHERCRALLATASELAEHSANPLARAFVHLAGASSAVVCGQHEAAIRGCSEAEQLLADFCPGEAWLLTNIRMTLCMALFLHAQHARFATLVKRWLEEARSRRDVFAVVALLGMGAGHCAFLMDDAPAEARELMARSMEPWRSRPRGFAQLGEFFSEQAVYAYVGGAEGYDWYVRHRQEHDRSILLQRGETLYLLSYARAISALRMIPLAPATQRSKLLAEARSFAARIQPAGVGRVFAPLAQAQIAAMEGKSDEALAAARSATELSRERGDRFFGLNAAYLLGVLEGGEGGRAGCAIVLDELRGQGWKDPWRGSTMWAPVSRVLEDKGPPFGDFAGGR